MKTKLRVELVASDARTSTEEVIAEAESDHFDPGHLEELIRSVSLAPQASSEKTRALEVVISLSSAERGTRPALHLSAGTIKALSAIGASLDFDPYVLG